MIVMRGLEKTGPWYRLKRGSVNALFHANLETYHTRKAESNSQKYRKSTLAQSPSSFSCCCRIFSWILVAISIACRP